MGGFRHQGAALTRHAVSDLADDRPDHAAAGQGQRAKDAAGAHGHLRLELWHRQGGQSQHLWPGFHPDDGRTGPPVAVGQRHQGEGAAGAVNLGRDILMRDRVGHGKGQRLLPVARGPHVDAQGLADGGIAPVCGDDHAGGHAGAVGQGHQGFRLARQQPGGGKAGTKIDIRQFRQTRDHFAAQQPVRQVPAEGLVGNVGSIEILDQARLGLGAACVDDPHHLQRGGKGFQPGPQARVLQDRDRRLQEGGCAQIGAVGIAICDRRFRVNAEHRKAGRPEGGSGGQPGNTAAGNQDIGGDPGHVASPVPSVTDRAAVSKGPSGISPGLTPG